MYYWICVYATHACRIRYACIPHTLRQGVPLNMPNTSICVLILLYVCPQLAGSPPRYHLWAHSRRQPAGAHIFSFFTLFISFSPLFFSFFSNAWIPTDKPAGAKYMSSYYSFWFWWLLLYICSHTSSMLNMCPHTTICVRILLYMCPQATALNSRFT